MKCYWGNDPNLMLKELRLSSPLLPIILPPLSGKKEVASTQSMQALVTSVIWVARAGEVSRLVALVVPLLQVDSIQEVVLHELQEKPHEFMLLHG